jgi:sulfur carrier protein
MTIQVNGEPKTLPDGASVTDLLTELKLTPDKVAIELNRKLLRSDRYDTSLKEADVLEVVTFVGGG